MHVHNSCMQRFRSFSLSPPLSSLISHLFSYLLSFLPLPLCSWSNPNEGGRPATSAYWADYTQAQLGAMMVTVPHCHRQPIFIEQSEAILAGPREATHLPTWQYFLNTRPQGLHLMHKAGLSTRHQGAAFCAMDSISPTPRFPACFFPVILRPWVMVRPEKNP